MTLASITVSSACAFAEGAPPPARTSAPAGRLTRAVELGTISVEATAGLKLTVAPSGTIAASMRSVLAGSVAGMARACAA